MGILEGKVALITGAGHGIGRAHALEFARQGAKVVVNDLGGSVSGEGQSRDADVVVDLIRKAGGEAIADYGNVADEAQAEAMVKAGLEEWGRFDVLVNNAGIVRDKAIWNMDAADWDAVVAVHLRGPWLTCRAAARHWRAQNKETGSSSGRIINTISGAGLSGHFGQTNYATAKSGVMGLTLTLSLELASIGVTVNAIGPGALTRLSATMPGAKAPREADEYGPDEFDPVGPQVSSPMVAWLASDEAAFVTGQCFKAMGPKITWMEGWKGKKFIHNGEKPWDAEKLGKLLSIDMFNTRAPGLRFED